MFATTVEGAPQLINRLSAFNKDVYKILQSDVKSAADLIAKDAKAYTPGQPTSHWSAGGRLGWAESTVDGKIKSRFRSRSIQGTRYVYAIVDWSSPAGNLFALAGSKTRTQFGELLNAMYGTPVHRNAPRALGPAWNAHIDEVRKQIQEAVDRAARKVV